MNAQIVHLAACNDEEYAEFASQQIAEYATQLVRAGEVSPEQGPVAARERLEDLTADRLRSCGHEFLLARSAQDAVRVGWVWLSPAPAFVGPGHEHSRWLSQITVEEALRGRGWGRAILAAVEQHEMRNGCDALWLRVFDWNVAARRLYESSGYRLVTKFPVDAHLCKRLTLA